MRFWGSGARRTSGWIPGGVLAFLWGSRGSLAKGIEIPAKAVDFNNSRRFIVGVSFGSGFVDSPGCKATYAHLSPTIEDCLGLTSQGPSSST